MNVTVVKADVSVSVHVWPFTSTDWVVVLLLEVCVSHTVVPLEKVQPDGVGGPLLAPADDAQFALRAPRQHSSSYASQALAAGAAAVDGRPAKSLAVRD